MGWINIPLTLKYSSRPLHVILLPLISFTSMFRGLRSHGTRTFRLFRKSPSISGRGGKPQRIRILDLEASKPEGNRTLRLARTCDPAIKVGVGGHFEAGVGHQEAGDVGEAGVDVFTHILQLLVLVLRDLRHKCARAQFGLGGSGGFCEVSQVSASDLQSLLQELHASLLSVGELVREAPVSDQENQGLRRTRNHLTLVLVHFLSTL